MGRGGASSDEKYICHICHILELWNRGPTPLKEKSPKTLCFCQILPTFSYFSILYPYTAERRDVLGNTSPRPNRFAEDGDFAPRGPRDCSRAEGDVFPNASRLEAVYVHSLSIGREVLILWCVCHLQLERSPS